MKKLVEYTGKVLPLGRANIDTDQIIPKQFLKRVERTGFGQFLFFDWRFDADGNENPQFIMNQDRYRHASILAAGPNFGCGSSREHAPWSLLDYGFQIVISASFADIFYQNCFKNGILPVILPEKIVEEIITRAETEAGFALTVNVANKTVVGPDFHATFELDAYLQRTLIEGLDDIERTLSYLDAIKQYEATTGK